MKNKIISVLTASATLAAAMSPSFTVSSEDTSSASAIRIMSVGDSITDGYTSEYTGSYRKFIYHGLTELGYGIDMVGSKGGGWTPVYTDEETGESFEYDNDNTGYSGYSIVSYPGRSGIYETLQETNCLAETVPDIVTLQIGTNDVLDKHDIDSSGDRLSTLITYILDNIPDDSALFVTTIPYLDPNRSDVYSWFDNYRHSDDWQTQYSDDEVEVAVKETVDKYNSIVKATVEEISVSHSNIYFADVNSAITDVKTQLFDGVHPNNTGYKAMGAYWTTVLDSYIKGEGSSEVTTSTTATTAATETTTTTTVTSETETSTTTTTAAETTSETTTVTETTTANKFVSENGYKVADILKLTFHLTQKNKSMTLTAEDSERLDMDKNGVLDIFDLVLLRRELLGVGAAVYEKLGGNLYEPETWTNNEGDGEFIITGVYS